MINVIYLVLIPHSLRRNLRAPYLQDLGCQGHGLYTDDKLVTLRLKSPAIRLFVQQLVQSSDKEPPKVRITNPARIINLMNCPLKSMRKATTATNYPSHDFIILSVDIGTNAKTGSKMYLAGGYENDKT